MAVKNLTKAKHRFPLRQLRHLGKITLQNWPVFALFFIVGLLIFLNFEPNTFLTGWDNLHPEFDIEENLKRTIFSVWQQYRGPGLLAGMAEGADLPRVLFVAFLLALKIAPNLIRYIITFIPLIIGPLGVYFLFYNHLFKDKLDSKTIQFASFLGALYYLLNLNTLQTFFVPFETFTQFYGALPWLLYFTINYLLKPNKFNLLVLFIVSFISSPSFYVESIFLVFIVAVLPFLVEFLKQQKNKAAHLKTVVTSLASLVIPHLFWLLPVAFFVLTNGSTPQQAKNNLISSPETYARNLQFATFKDTALMKGYLFNYLDLGQDNKYTYLLSTWRSHLGIPVINLLGFLSFILILTGFYYSFKKKFTWTKSFVALLALCLFFLFGGGILISQKLPIIGELFRSPFTKFSIPLSLAYSFFFSIGTIFLLDIFTFLHTRLTYYLTLFTVAFSLILFMSPAFSGNLIYPAMRRQIPLEYFNLFSYLKSQDPSTRIANFPQFSFWGWVSYDWGYRGSGFLWYGLRQPLMDRAFDVWEKNSEHYYEEMSSALYSEDQKNLDSVFDKYSVNWLLIDEHIVLPENATDSGLVSLKKYISSSSKYSLDKKFGDKISLYKVKPENKTENFLSVQKPINTVYPFANLSLRPNTDWTQKGDYLNTAVPVTVTSGNTLTVPSISETESLLPVKIEYRKQGGNLDLRLTPIIPTIFLDTSQLDLQSTPITISIPDSTGTGFVLELNKNYYELQLPAEIDNFFDYFPLTTAYLPTKSPFSVALFNSTEISLSDLTNSLFEADPVQCYVIKPNHKVEKLTTQSGVSLVGTDVVGCLSAPLPFVPRGNLISLAFTYSSPTLTPGSVNISGRDRNALNLPQTLEPKNTPTRARIFTQSTGSYQQVNLVLEAGESKTIKEIDYENVEVSVLPLIYSASVSLPKIPEKKVILEGSATRLQISLPDTASQFDSIQTPTSNSLLPENQNCDQQNSGKTVKLTTDSGFLYQSQGAVECDTLNLRHLPHSINYLISFNLRAEKGLLPTICLENHTSRRCDINERLIKDNHVQSVIQPIANTKESPGYTLHIYNQSFGNKLTSNLIKQISVRPIPLQFLKNIVIEKANDTNQNPTPTIISSTHPYSFLYTVSVSGNSSSVLNLYQTKSTSWKAIQVSLLDFKLHPQLIVSSIPLVYPLLPKLPHADSGLWYNSWTLPQGDSTIIIFYLPQYLEFVGFLLIILTPAIILVIRSQKKSSANSKG